MIVDVTVEFPRDAADHGAAIHIGRGQPRGRDAAKVGGRREEDDGFAQASGLDRSADAGESFAVDDDVGRVGGEREQQGEEH